ncbi:hypothetical protein TgHK011_000156 [Trichoderma gracile]|nr:hypothetical protein TgHK011_000156 [Trichoderma gracile]
MYPASHQPLSHGSSPMRPGPLKDPSLELPQSLLPPSGPLSNGFRAGSLNGLRMANAPFHRQLYANGFFPSSMQDAFSTTSIHHSCNSRNQDIIARNIQDRANPLTGNARIEQGSLMPAVPLNTLRAEEAMPTLLSGCQQMWDSATLDCIACHTPGAVKEASQQNCDSSSRLWNLWTLYESVRRTWPTVTITVPAYRTIKDEWCECTRGIMFTARRSL